MHQQLEGDSCEVDVNSDSDGLTQSDPGQRALNLPRLKRESLRGQVVEVLEQQILDGRRPMGSEIPSESELAEGLGVSRTVVRDALRLLEARGLVEIRRGVRTVVRPPSHDGYAAAAALLLIRSDLTLGDVFEARATLEGQLAVIAAERHTPEHLQRVSAALDRFGSAVAARDYAAIVRAHVVFHSELLRAANLPALDVLLEPLQQMMMITSVVGRGMRSTERRAWRVGVHRALFDAIASRDQAAVAAANTAHWRLAVQGASYGDVRNTRVKDMFQSPRDLLPEFWLRSDS